MAIQFAEQLEGLGFHFFFFAADEGDDVVEDVHGGDAGVASAADGLHGGDKDLLDAEALLDRLKRHDQADGGAIGIGDHVAAGGLARGLLLDEVQMIRVDLGNDQGDIGRHAEGAGIGKHGASGVGEPGLHFAGEGGVDGGEDNLGRTRGIGGLDGHFGDALGERGVETPLCSFAVGFPAGAVAGGEPGDLEPWVVFKQLNVTLADHSGGAEDADWLSVFHGS